MDVDSTFDAPAPALARGEIVRWLGVAVSPLVLTVVAVTGLYLTVGLTPIPHAPTAVYDAANLLVVALLAWWVSTPAEVDVFRYRVPSPEEVGGAVVVALVTVFAFDPLGTATAAALGAGSGSVGSFESALGAVVFGVGAIAVAPIAEEVLYRGLAFGVLRARYGAVAAVVGSSILFGGIHVFIGGVSGVVSALLTGLAYAWLRWRYDNLAGVGVAHALTNVYWVAVMLGAIPNLAPQ